jgi:hypothetical protein
MGALDDAIREHLELKRQHGASDDEIRRAEAEALGPARRESGAGPIDLGEPGLETGHIEEPVQDERFVQEQPGASATGDYLVTDPPPPPPPPPPDPADDAYLVAEPDAPPVEPHPVEPVAEHEQPSPEPPAPPPPVAPPPPGEPPREAPAPGTPKPHGDPAFEHEEHQHPPAQDDAGAHAPPGEPPVDPDRARTAILDDPLDELAALDRPPLHHEPGPDEPPAPARPPDASGPAGPEAHGAPPDEDVLEETPDFLQETPEHDRLWFEQKPPRDFDFDD